jgi:hypothetical protein
MLSQGPSRRSLLRSSAALAGGAVAAPAMMGAVAEAKATVPETPLVWLDGKAPEACDGTTFGVPWPRGALKGNATLKAVSGTTELPVQSWPIAYWPDGSLKWSAIAVPALDTPADGLKLVPGKPAAPKAPVSVTKTATAFVVTSGDVAWTVPFKGPAVIASATQGGKPVLGAVSLITQTQSAASLAEADNLSTQSFTGEVETATLEQSGPVRAVIKLEGKHKGNGREWLPFTLRLYFYAGADNVRVVHSFIFDGDATRDFIRSMGLQAKVSLTDELYNRHIRFSGEGNGVWAEAVRTLTGLRRDPGKAFKDAQIAGKAVPPVEQMGQGVGAGLKWIPPWGDFSLSQPTPDGFSIKKRTEPGHAWIDSAADGRASGLVYAGGVSGGVALAMKDFWQRVPSGLDIRGAATAEATLTAWMWSPDAPAMDMRSYRPVWGMDTYAKQNEGLNITYEDYEPGYDNAYGIARTTEFTLWTLKATPENAALAAMAHENATPPRLTVSPQRLKAAGVFGEWTTIDTSTPTRKLIEDRIDYQLDYYLSQIEQHRWYGFWTYGDVMHTYDADRHMWRYDVGGFAWDNSELSTDMMLWYGYLRSGRADVFRMCEAMTRQTGEVDVYHIGPWRGFGTRHGVQPFSDSSKQPRVSNAAYRRFFYYLTADERTGDLMRALNDSEESLTRVKIERKVGEAGGSGLGIRPKLEGTVDCAFGTSWGAFLSAWLTEWERTGDTKWRDRIVNGMISIAKLKYGWFSGGAPMDLKTGTFLGDGNYVGISHLNGVFGVFEMHMELFQLVDVPAYKKVWLDYCKYYNAPNAEITAFLGQAPKGRNLREAHSRFTAYAGRELKDDALLKRAWEEFIVGEGRPTSLKPKTTHIEGPVVLHALDEDAQISTNGAAQWGLAAIENLSIMGDTVERLAAPLVK